MNSRYFYAVTIAAAFSLAALTLALPALWAAPAVSFGRDDGELCEKWTFDSVAVPQPHFDTAEQACKAYLIELKMGGNNNIPNNPTPYTVPVGKRPVNTYHCYWCSQRRGTCYAGTVERAVREPWCNQEVCGPYRNLPEFPYVGRGREYDGRREQKKIILERNSKLHHITVNETTEFPHKSDVHEFTTISENPACVDGLLRKSLRAVGGVPLRPCSAQVHHIIPRVDTKGCPCGKNSVKNALVISGELNNQIKNSQPSPEFIHELLQKYPCP